MGFALYRRSTKNAAANSAAPIQSMLAKAISAPPNATSFRIDSPADRISATTTGRRQPSTLSSSGRPLYLR